ncbi:Golgi Transport, partial [Spiromyces aspiralis]
MGSSGGSDKKGRPRSELPPIDVQLPSAFEPNESALFVNNDLKTGFKLSNGVVVNGPMLIVNGESFEWKVGNGNSTKSHPFKELDGEAFRILEIVNPKPELLVLGTGAVSYMLSPRVRDYLTSIGIPVEQSNTIGVGLTAFGVALTFLGVILFFDAGLIAIGNILFLSGVALIIGVQKTVVFFARRDKLKGSLCFFAGFLLVFFR